MPRRATLVLADRPTARPALVALAAALEGSDLSSHVTLALARGPAAVADAVGKGRCAGEVVLVGAQSGSDRLLAALERGHGVAEVKRAVRLCREAGFGVAVDFIVGLPGEQEEDLEPMRSLIARLAEEGARIRAHAFLPLPGTPWRDAPPGRIDGLTRSLLHRLESRGRAYGQWRRQERLAGALSGFRLRQEPGEPERTAPGTCARGPRPARRSPRGWSGE